jgi:hypothetical protein
VTISRRVCGALACAVALLAFAVPARAAPPSDDEPSPMAEGGRGIAAGVATLVYTPTKIAYALGGLLVAGVVYAYSGGDGETVARAVYAPLRGDYVVTPGHLTGKRKLRFIGQHR